MKKLISVFAVAALSTTLAIGCKKKGADEGKDNTAPKTDEAKPDDKKPADDKKPDDKKPADDKKPDDKGSAAAPAAGGNADIPAECNDYKAAMEKLAACDKMPQASKDALKQGYDAMSQGWAAAKDMPAEAKKAMADGCKQGADALMQSGKALCGW